MPKQVYLLNVELSEDFFEFSKSHAAQLNMQPLDGFIYTWQATLTSSEAKILEVKPFIKKLLPLPSFMLNSVRMVIERD